MYNKYNPLIPTLAVIPSQHIPAHLIPSPSYLMISARQAKFIGKELHGGYRHRGAGPTNRGKREIVGRPTLAAKIRECVFCFSVFVICDLCDL